MLVYDTLEQARMRLRQAVITYRDQAVFVFEVQQPSPKSPIQLSLRPYPLDVHSSKRPPDLVVDIDDPDLNFRIFRVGYINDRRSKNTAFLTRHTRRQQTQGLSVPHLTGGEMLDHLAFNSKEFEDMLFGRYPTVDEALRMINDDQWMAVGISHNFALARDMDIKLLRSLLYRGRRVGVSLGSKFSEFLVDKKDEYLKEVLQDAGFPFRVE